MRLPDTTKPPTGTTGRGFRKRDCLRLGNIPSVTIDEFSSADLHDLADGFTTSFIATINT
jgi:hypothetical protein